MANYSYEIYSVQNHARSFKWDVRVWSYDGVIPTRAIAIGSDTAMTRWGAKRAARRIVRRYESSMRSKHPRSVVGTIETERKV